VLPTLPGASEVGSYVVFELWDSMPGPSSTTAGLSRRPSRSEEMDLLVTPRGTEEKKVEGISSGMSSRAGSAKAPRKPVGTIVESLDFHHGRNGATNAVLPGDRVLRIILNNKAFNRDGSASHLINGEEVFVCDGHAMVLADLTMPQLSELVASVIKALEPTGLPKHWQMPNFM
jgi:hypothetical protein